MEADRCCLTGGKHDLLRILTGTGIRSVDGTVLMSQFLDIHRASGESCGGDLTVIVGDMGIGDQSVAGSIGIETELSPCQILTVLSCLGKIKSRSIQVIYKAYRSCLVSGEVGNGDGTKNWWYEAQRSGCSGRIGIDTELPTRQDFAILRGFLDARRDSRKIINIVPAMLLIFQISAHWGMLFG